MSVLCFFTISSQFCVLNIGLCVCVCFVFPWGLHKMLLFLNYVFVRCVRVVFPLGLHKLWFKFVRFVCCVLSCGVLLFLCVARCVCSLLFSPFLCVRYVRLLFVFFGLLTALWFKYLCVLVRVASGLCFFTRRALICLCVV